MSPTTARNVIARQLLSALAEHVSEYRSDYPEIDEQQWTAIVRQAGFLVRTPDAVAVDTAYQVLRDQTGRVAAQAQADDDAFAAARARTIARAGGS